MQRCQLLYRYLHRSAWSLTGEKKKCRRYRGTLSRKCSRSSLRDLRLLISYERSQCTSTCLEFTPIFASIFFFCQWPRVSSVASLMLAHLEGAHWHLTSGPGFFFGSKSTVIISARTMLNQRRFISFKRKNVLLVDITSFCR